MKYEITNASVLRLSTLMTHYRSPLNFSEERMKEARKILERWMFACEPCRDNPPTEVLECFCNDLNTPNAIALLHKYRKEDGKKLFASMRFLGFFDCEPSSFPSEWKTLPAEISSENSNFNP